MKRIIYLILFSLTLLVPVNSALADEPVITESKGILKPKTGNGGIKRTPSLLFIECESVGYLITFSPNFTYSYMDVTVVNEESGMVYYETITPSQPYVEVFPESGVLSITIETDSGVAFEGEISTMI